MSNTKPTTPITIVEVMMLKYAGFKALFAYALLVEYGKTLFPGIDQAAVNFIAVEIPGDDADFDQEGVLPLGCAKGGRFGGEKVLKSVMEHLSLADKPQLMSLIDEVSYCVDKGGSFPAQLSEIVKVAGRFPEHDSRSILNWALKAITMIIRRSKFPYVPEPGEKTLVELFRNSSKELPYMDDPRVRSYMFDAVHKSMERKDSNVTELAYAVESLIRCGYSEADTVEWLKFGLRCMCFDQIEFWRVVKSFEGVVPIKVRALLRGRDSLKLFVCTSDSTYAQKAARYLGGDLVLMRNTAGNVIIFTDNKVNGLNLANAARMIRWFELPLNKKKGADWRELGKEGVHPDVKNWDYRKKKETLSNANRRDDQNVANTGIAPQTLIEVLKNAFHPRNVAWWCAQRQIERNIPDSMPAPVLAAPVPAPVPAAPAPTKVSALVSAQKQELVAA